MFRFGLVCFALTVSAMGLVGEESKSTLPEISIERIKADVRYLASDRLEGRGVGTRGEELTTDYLAEQFKKAGLKPFGERGSFFQAVPLVLVNTGKDATLEMIHGKDTTHFKLEDEFVGVSYAQQSEDFECEVIFMGHGITAPEFNWDDYAGTDVKGKIVLLFTNEPPSEDPKFFNAKALTYYGRWTYKYEEATRRGAKAVFIIHTSETAGYPYSVVKKLNGAQLQREEGKPALAFAGWLSATAGEKLLKTIGLSLEDAIKKADTRGFKPIPMPMKLKGHIPTTVKRIVSKNVIAAVEGSDPTLKSEAVLFTAHWDHLGMGKSPLGQDEIFSGALDNGSGSGILLELARAWTKLEPRPKRTAIFLSTTAEESGLLGAFYYAAHPVIPLGKTAINFNFDTISPVGEPEALVLNGSERTTAYPRLEAVAKRHGLPIEGDARAGQGLFYRSDHFAMAKGGVPAFSVNRGQRVKGKPLDFTKKLSDDFTANIYHTPNDKFKEEWDFAGYPILMRFTLDAAREIANDPKLPTWNPGDEFLPAREKSGVK
jgi:Zn-dependent M28 family amino/carboxypeptidase